MDVNRLFVMLIFAGCFAQVQLKLSKEGIKLKFEIWRSIKSLFTVPPKLVQQVLMAKNDTELNNFLTSGRCHSVLVVYIFVNGKLPLEMVPKLNEWIETFFLTLQIIVVNVKKCGENAKKYSIKDTSKPTYVFHVLTFSHPKKEEDCRHVCTDNYRKDLELIERKIKEIVYLSKYQASINDADFQNKLRNYKSQLIYTVMLYFHDSSNGCESCSEISSTFDRKLFFVTVFVLVDVDLCPETAKDYGVDKNCLPALAVFDNVKEPNVIGLEKNIGIDTTKNKIEEALVNDYDKYVLIETEPVQIASKEEDVRDLLNSKQNKLVILYFYTERDLTILKNIRWYTIDKEALAIEVDVGKCPNTAAEYKVDESKLPVFVIFFNGKGVNIIHRVNEYNKGDIRNKVNEILSLKSREVRLIDIKPTDV